MVTKFWLATAMFALSACNSTSNTDSAEANGMTDEAALLEEGYESPPEAPPQNSDEYSVDEIAKLKRYGKCLYAYQTMALLAKNEFLSSGREDIKASIGLMRRQAAWQGALLSNIISKHSDQDKGLLIGNEEGKKLVNPLFNGDAAEKEVALATVKEIAFSDECSVSKNSDDQEYISSILKSKTDEELINLDNLWNKPSN